MRSVKIFGLAAVAAVATMALIGVTSASAADNVVLCKKLVSSTELCPAGELLPKGTKILALNEGIPILKGVLNEQCEDSHVDGITDFETGPSLLGKITNITFTKNCKPCKLVTMEELPYVSHLLHENGKWVLHVLNPKAKLSECTGGFECVFGASTVLVDVQDNAGVLLIDSLEAPLSLLIGPKILCGETGKWIATYKAECKNAGGTVIPCWPALDKEEAEK